MIKYDTDEVIKKAGNKYVLACAIAKYAKILNVKQQKGEIDPDVKTINYATIELMDDNIKII
ncbi:MAG: DNA-directed RNA polymerase subunit omega [Clostridia bacterium]|nr:DNA-directed RNA polymerase subunit omega [Clostridia bacterium]